MSDTSKTQTNQEKKSPKDKQKKEVQSAKETKPEQKPVKTSKEQNKGEYDEKVKKEKDDKETTASDKAETSSDEKDGKAKTKTLVTQNFAAIQTYFQKNSKQIAIFAFIFLIIFGLLYVYNNWFIIARINGQPVYRTELYQRLEERAGSEVLQQIITEELILQRGSSEGVSVSDEAIDERIASIESQITAQGQTLDQALSIQGLDIEQLREQIRLEEILTELSTTEVEITEEAIDEYIENNEQLAESDEDLESVRAQARQELEFSQESQSIQQLLQQIRSEADIIIKDEDLQQQEGLPF